MIYLIDFENVHEEGFSAIGKVGDKDAVYCFFTKNVAKISMSALAGIRSGQLHFVEAESGKQSLDLALVSFLGYLIGTRPQEQCFEIVSNDNGFSKVAEFWNKRGNTLRVRIRKTAEQRSKGDMGKPASSSKRLNSKASAADVRNSDLVPDESEALNGSLENGTSGMDDIGAQVTSPAGSAAETKSTDSGIISGLLAAGISQQAAEYILSQVEKYREDKNVKQLVYRAVVKKYGQKSGTQIYNSAKKIMLK